MDEVLGGLIDDALRSRSEAVALIQGGRSLTYRQLDAAANRVASALGELGISGDDRVALLFGNDVSFVECLLGVFRAGAVAVPVNVRLGDEALAYVVGDAAPRVLLTSRALAERTRSLAIATPGQTPVVVADDRWIAHASAQAPSVRVAPQALCLQPYTSGSTGRPKGVLLAHAGQRANVETVTRALLLTAEDRALIAVPLFHANALCCALFPVLRAGGSVIIMDAFDGPGFVRALDEHACTYTTGVPAMYRMVLDELHRRGRRAESLQAALIGSAIVPDALHGEMADAFPNAAVIEAYGLTEGGPVVSMNPRAGERRVGSIGVPLPGSEVRILDGAGVPVPTGDIGELHVKNAGVTVGFNGLPEVTAARVRDGWLATGDLVSADTEGYLYFKGRADDMLNVGGENVYPREIEEILASNPAVADVSVVPIRHPVKGEVPVAFVVVRTPASETQLRNWFLDRGPAYAHPRAVIIVDALPLLGTGKVDRAALQARAEREVATDG